MKASKIVLLLSLTLCLLTPGVASSEEASSEVRNLVTSEVVPLGGDPLIVDAVKAQNARRMTLDQIKELDRKWSKTPGVADFMKALIDSPCGKRLRVIQKEAGYYAEIFVMDNQGAIVCMTDKTSDYWQGDEDKFNKSYDGGVGNIFVNEVKFDESSQSYLVQASVPIKDGDRVIGAIMAGIDIDALEKR